MTTKVKAISMKYTSTKQLQCIPLQDDDYSEREHQACSYAVELTVTHRMNVLQYSKPPKDENCN